MSLKVLHVTPTFYPATRYGGTIDAVLSLCLGLRSLGCELKVLSSDSNGPVRLTSAQKLDPVIRPLNVEFCNRLGGEMVIPSLLRKLPEWVAWADVVHLTAVYNFTTFPTLIEVRRQKKPLVWSPHGTLQRWQNSRRVSAKAAWDLVCRALKPPRSVLHVTSFEEAQESVPKLGIRNFSCIPNAIALPKSVPPVTLANGLKLLFIGRLDPKKGLENLISALRLLLNRGFVKWRLKIAGRGDGKFEAKLRQLILDARIEHLIEFIGHVENEQKFAAFAWSHVVVAPSFTENFGLVVAEALAHARPVIVSRGMPWKEVENRACGAWVPNDPESLAAAVQNAASWNVVAMGNNGRLWMAESFSWSARATQMLSLYESLRQDSRIPDVSNA